MLKAIQRFLLVLLMMLAGLYVLYQGFLYLRARPLMPTGMLIAGVEVAGLTSEEAATAVEQAYFAPFYVQHSTEQVALNPADVGFVIDTPAMMQLAEEAKTTQDPWLGFLQFMLQRPFEPVQIELRAAHDPALLAEQLQRIAEILDTPAQPARLAAGGSEYIEGVDGVETDVAASLPAVEQVLYQPDDRVADLVVAVVEAPTFGIEVLEANLLQELQRFSGIGAIFIMDLQTGEEVNINADVALSGLSILKIGIIMEAYRATDGQPDLQMEEWLYDTAVESSNWAANNLLHVAAGENNTYEGAAIFTESMQRLGLVNTFMAVPYDAPIVSTRPSTYQTPANTSPNLVTFADPARQTTAADIGTLLSMIYYCSQGGGALLAVYPGEITPEECQAMIDLMAQNDVGNLIRFGVPETAVVSHKHGWGDNITHGDAGIVLTEGGDYVIVTYLHDPDTDFLVSDFSFPILWELSRITYNYFNFEDPYLENLEARALREAEERGLLTPESELAGEQLTEPPVEEEEN